MSGSPNPTGNTLEGLEALVTILAGEKRPLPNLLHEHAVQCDGEGDLLWLIAPGDQIAVRSSENEHFHHGIFIGRLEG